MLAYRVCNRTRSITPDEIVDLLWNDKSGSSNPFNALKTVFYRARATLEPLEENVGQHLILRQDATYVWNTEVPLHLDVGDFERLCKAGAHSHDTEEKIRYWLEALSLYTGNFLPKLSSELWLVPLATHYHNLYVNTALELFPLLEEQERREECVELCRTAVQRDAYIEDFYQHWIQALLRLNRQQEAIAVYEKMSELFLAEFGVMPSEELLALYRDALQPVDPGLQPPVSPLPRAAPHLCSPSGAQQITQ